MEHHWIIVDLSSLWFCLWTLIGSTEACSFIDPCMGVKCPSVGQECNWAFPYCHKHVCPPIATCQDPCANVVCKSEEECAVVEENCHQPLCPVKGRCNARQRAGRCPDEPDFTITSCTAQCQDDHLCPRNYKCCNGFCIPPLL